MANEAGMVSPRTTAIPILSGRVGLAALIVLILFTLCFRLNVYPTLWFDRGVYLNVIKDESAYLNVARTYAETGIYAETSSEGYRFTGAVPSTGPTVILPVALLFSLFGVNVTLARLVMVAYGLLAFAALYGLSSRLNNRQTGLLALLLAFLIWGDQFPYIFRNVLGEGASLALLLTGLWLWLRPGKRHVTTLVAVGGLIGLACITKNQTAFFALPALLVGWLLDLFWYRRAGWQHFVIPGMIAGVMYFGWTYYVYFLLGANMRDVTADLAALRSAAGQAYFVFDRSKIGLNLYALTEGGVYVGLLLPSLLYGLKISMPRTDEGQRQGILLVFLLSSLIIFVFSAGWIRILVPPIWLAAPFVARLAHDLTGGFDLKWLKTAAWNSNQAPVYALILGIGLAISIIPLGRVLYYVVATGSTETYDTAAYLNEHIPQDAVIETWDKELAVLTDHQYHHPPQLTETRLNAYQQWGAEPVNNFYDFREYGTPAYIVIGPFSRYAEIYPKDRLTGYEPLAQVGEYEIYQLQKD